MKICTVVIGNTLNEFLDNLKEIQKVSNFVELRVDYIKNLSLKDIEIIRKNTFVESIFTCRTIDAGGNFKGNIGELLEIIKVANTLKFEHIDVEVELLKYINFNKNSKIIGSYHNFDMTPKYDDLLLIYDSIKKYDIVDIVKIATMVLNDDDNINLVKLLIKKKNSIILGMGEKGKIIRIVAPLLGGYLTFASINKDNISANGQLMLEEFKQLYGE